MKILLLFPLLFAVTKSADIATTSTDHPFCNIPFYFDGKLYTSCTREHNAPDTGNCYCAGKVNATNEMAVEVSCASQSCSSPTSTTAGTTNGPSVIGTSCATTTANLFCKFPFTYTDESVLHNECIKTSPSDSNYYCATTTRDYDHKFITMTQCTAYCEGVPPFTHTGTSTGQDLWDANIDHDCCGDKQSPININLGDVLTKESLKAITYSMYDTSGTYTMSLDGHFLIGKLKTGTAPTITGLRFGTTTYTFHEFVIHWGSVDCQGSEHTIANVRYASEVQLVHYKTSYGSFDAAKTHDDGLVILSILYTADGTCSTASTLTFLKTPVTALVAGPTTTQDVTMKLDDFLAGLTTAEKLLFSTYWGSLTWPGCNESVFWVVFTTATQKICTKTGEEGALLRTIPSNAYNDNFRIPQPVKNRALEKPQ